MPLFSHHRRRVVLCVVALAAALLAWWGSHRWPGAQVAGRWGFIYANGFVAFGHASSDLQVYWDPGQESPVFQFANSMSSCQVWATSTWRPSVSAMEIDNFTSVTTFNVLWVPLWWPPAIVVLGIAALAWVAVRARRHGRCANCGYDCRGLAHRRCPECGQSFAMT